MKPIRVFIVDDHPMVIEGLQNMLRADAAFELVGHAMSASSCKGFFVSQFADVVLLDINLPDESGIQLCKYLKNLLPCPHILAISSFDSGTFISDMMNHGADGYVMKNVSKEELTKAIFAITQGRHYLSHDANEKLKAEKNRREQMPVLTVREKEVLQLIASGLTNAQIAEKLFVSVSTIDSHRKNLLAKLHANNTASLLKTASENFLLTSEK
ncbi:MAG: response regulator transcription factor [Bacteroidetes bacterium]|nr:response regulator transcription factor [Bacteroidota bacterium]